MAQQPRRESPLVHPRCCLVCCGLFAVLILLLFPVLFCLFLVKEGIFLVRKEGLRPSNLLTLALAACIAGLPVFLFPFFGGLTRNRILTGAALFLVLFLGWFACLGAVFFLGAVVSQIHLLDKNRHDYVVVLGCGLMGRQVTPLLASRIRRGIDVLKKNPRAKLVLSGGQGPDEAIPEAEAMKAFALEQGIREKQILIEAESTDTEENLKYSRDIILEDWGEAGKPRIAIATSDYHVFRALALARRMKMQATGYGSRTRLYFSLNAFLREFAGYLSLVWKRQVLLATAVALPLAAAGAFLISG